MKRSAVQLVWFKKDLRVSDHQPLATAAKNGPVVCLFIHEPEWWAAPECDGSHRIFLAECLADLDSSLRRCGVNLVQRHGNAVDVLERLSAEIDIEGLWSHEETGADWTYKRDLAVLAWCRQRGIPWREFRQDGVVRRLKNRNGWAEMWQRTMHRALLEPPDRLHGPSLENDALPQADRDWVSTKPWAQRGGERIAESTLDEFLNHRGAKDFTETPEARQRLEAWQNGLTGYPMVDACMRCVKATGWLNFRMRAMLMSFASHHLWLHWRPTGIFLARHFLDFEPGIHFSQVQMQSATTGINTVRIYSPAKQALDQDPQGRFIKLWVPELEGVPVSWLAEPHRMQLEQQSAAGCHIGVDYPAPIVDHATAYREARLKIALARREPAAREEARRVFLRHGSRKRRAPRPTAKQLDLAIG